MEGLMYLTTGSKVSRTSWCPRIYCALILGSVVLVSMATTSSPVEDGYLLPFDISSGRTEDLHTALSPETQGNSFSLRPVLTTAGATLETLSEATGQNGNTTEKTFFTGWSVLPSQGSKPPTSRGSSLALEESNSIPPQQPAKPAEWSQVFHNPDMTITPVRQTRDLKQPLSSLFTSASLATSGSLQLLGPNTKAWSSRSTLPFVSDTVTPSDHQPPLPQSNVSAAPLHTSLLQRITSSATLPQFTVPNPLLRTSDDPIPSLKPNSQQNTSVFTVQGIFPSVPAAHAESTVEVITPAREAQNEEVNSASSFTDKKITQKVGDTFSPSLPVKTFSRDEDFHSILSSIKPQLNNATQGIHLLLKTPSSSDPEMLSPSFVPFLRPHAMLVTTELTLVPSEEFFPTGTIETDFGSGDYLETISFMGSEVDDLSLVTNLPTDMYDVEESVSERYDTSFPSRQVLPLSSMHIVTTSSNSGFPTINNVGLGTIHPTSVFSSHGQTVVDSFAPLQNFSFDKILDSDWVDSFTVEPTELLLPDMNSLEYYSILLAMENALKKKNNQTSGEHINFASVEAPHITPTSLLTLDQSHILKTAIQSNETLSLLYNSSSLNANITALQPSNTMIFVNSTISDSTRVLMTETPSLNMSLFDLSLGDVHSLYATTVQWFASLSYTATATVSLQATQVSAISELISPTSVDLSRGVSSLATVIPMANYNTTTNDLTTNRPVTTMFVNGMMSTGKSATASTTNTYNSKITTPFTPATLIPSPESTSFTTPRVMSTSKTPQSTATRHYLCNITKMDTYLVRTGLATTTTLGYAKAYIREILKNEFNRSVELQVLKPPPDFIFRVVSGPVVYTAVSVVNALRSSAKSSSAILSVTPVMGVPDHQFQVHSVLQFVPSHVDVRFCNFSERIEKGLIMAFSEVRRRYQESPDFIVHIINITMNLPKAQKQLQRVPVDIIFAIRDSTGYLNGSEVSSLLRNLNMVEFSFYLGFPVLQIAEPFHYPELNVTQLLRSSWVKTVLLGVMEQRVNERTFQAKMERRLAQLLGEVLGSARRWKRATNVGNNSVQIVRTTRLDGPDNPLEMIYFVEGPNGERLAATTTSSILNQINVQRAAIVLGYRVQGVLAQPVEKITAPPSETQNNNLWIVVGVVVPVVVVIVIIIILYWKLCRTDKLEFQPDTMSNVQQRQKLQAPSVKGFDFAKLHLGQHNKDDILVIQESAPLPAPVKEVTPSESGDVPSPKSKASSKVSRGAKRRGRISPSDAESTVSEPSSGRESAEESTRPSITPNDGKQHRKTVRNGKFGPPQMNGTEEPLSSASIFEHVDRMSRTSEATKRVSNKIQLIAMQPMPASPLHSTAVLEKVSETAKINKEIQTALRHKSEIEHHRNKIRLRAKRKGHYDFPAMDDIGIVDSREHRRIYQKAQMQIDRILDPEVHVPSVFIESKKSARGKRSPKQRRKHQVNGSLTDADKDRLITTDSDGTYKKPPGVNNVAYVSDPDQAPEPRSPSPQDNEVFVGSPPPGHAPPPPAYVPPQPSIEEARQQMHSLLDDAFALVAPTSQGTTAGITLPGVTSGPLSSSPPPRTSRGAGTGQWGSPYTAAQGLSPFSARYAELGMSPPSVQGLLQRQGLGSGYLQPGEPGRSEPPQTEGLYSGRGVYSEELPSSARPRPVGGTTGAQLHHLTQVGLSSRISAYPGVGRAAPSSSGSSGWTPYRSDEEYARAGHNRDAVLGFPEYTSSSVFQMPRTSLREPSAPPAHLQHNTLESSGTGYPSAPPEESPPSHSSASLIKAIREELMRLSQKQSAVQSFHS
ncbi:K1549 protein, partial [Atractosteus spatula]|nr:K1549 protein [Atractosteus spatula]